MKRASNFPDPDKSLSTKLDLAQNWLNYQNLTERLNQAIDLEDETVSLYQNYTGKSTVQNNFFQDTSKNSLFLQIRVKSHFWAWKFLVATSRFWKNQKDRKRSLNWNSNTQWSRKKLWRLQQVFFYRKICWVSKKLLKTNLFKKSCEIKF